jgi:hypothetical protein
MAIKKSTLGNISSKSLEEVYKCGECLHHAKHVHPTMKVVCSKNGVRTFAIAPKCFTPDVTQIANNSDTFVQLAALFSDYTPKQKRIMLALLRQKPITKFRKDMPFGTKVYFHGLGKDYISNYLSGYVMGVTSSGELIITGSPEQNTRGRSYMAYMPDADLLMNVKEWKVKKAELKASGRILDPQSLIMPKANPEADPVTIDSAPDAWYDKQEKQTKKRRSTDMVYQVQ